MPGARSGRPVLVHIGAGCGTSGEKQRRGVWDLYQAAIAHLEHTDLIGGAETVLDGAQDAELVPAFAFEIKDGVDHVLEYPRAGDDPLLCHMAHEDQHKTTPFGGADLFLRHPPHLA